MARIMDEKRKIKPMWIVLILLSAFLLCVLLCGCQKVREKLNSAPETDEEKPYAVKTVLKECSAVDADTGTGIYARYTELIAPEAAPETLKQAIAECNRRAEEAAQRRMQSVPSTLSAETLKEKSADYRFETYAYIVTITRADRAVFSILETEYEAGLRDSFTGEQEVSYHFRGSSFDMASGRELSLSELVPDEKALQERLPEALKVQYGTDGLAGTEPSDYSWTADALGIRFYFNSDAVSGEKRREIWGYDDDRVITVAFPYDTLLDGSMSQKLSEAPKAYIARIDRETVYDLPYGDFSIMLTKDESRTIIRVMPDHGSESSLEIGYADDQSDFYIIRSHGGFYLFREEVGDQDGFFYDFSSPDGGYGRFAYNPSQYFDSFMREIKLALPYDPYCAHMSRGADHLVMAVMISLLLFRTVIIPSRTMQMADISTLN